MAEQIFNVLFLCTGNSARSVLAEAILTRVGKDKFNSHSAGSFPKGTVHPQAIRLLNSLGHKTSGLRSKSWNEFSEPDASKMDFVFTVCDNAATETCPVWIGHPMTAHWGVPDPAAAIGNDAEIALAFNEAYRQMHNRIIAFVNLPIASLDRMSLKNQLVQIGKNFD